MGQGYPQYGSLRDARISFRSSIRFPFRRDGPHTPPAGGYADEDDSLAPPSPEGWHSFHPWWQMASDEADG